MNTTMATLRHPENYATAKNEAIEAKRQAADSINREDVTREAGKQLASEVGILQNSLAREKNTMSDDMALDYASRLMKNDQKAANDIMSMSPHDQEKIGNMYAELDSQINGQNNASSADQNSSSYDNQYDNNVSSENNVSSAQIKPAYTGDPYSVTAPEAPSDKIDELIKRAEAGDVEAQNIILKMSPGQ